MSNLETVRSFYSGAAAGDLDAIRSRSWRPGCGFKGVPHEFIVDGDAIVQMRQYTDTALVHAAWK